MIYENINKKRKEKKNFSPKISKVHFTGIILLDVGKITITNSFFLANTKGTFFNIYNVRLLLKLQCNRVKTCN